MKASLAACAALLSCSKLVIAAPQTNYLAQRQASSTGSNGRPDNYTQHIFDQRIDHFLNSSRYEPHTNATFNQSYYYDDTYYQPGGPVFLYIGGETDGPSRFSNLETGIIQILMQATNGLGVILENRYYGESLPYEDFTTDHLAYLTTEQTIADNAYFAQHATFPNCSKCESNMTALNKPWILYGGSLAGAQTAFSLVKYHGLLWGGIASSGVIIYEKTYPQWYDPIQKYAPGDCTTRINNIVDKIDSIIAKNNTMAIQQLKDIFGLGPLSDLRDFAMTIAFPIGGPFNYPGYTWQELNWYPEYDHQDFWEFCGNVTYQYWPQNITDVDMALANYTNGEAWTGLGGYAEYIKNVVVPDCPSEDLIDTTTAGCFSTQNESYWADTTPSVTRAYLYSTCTEAGAYQVAQPEGTPSLLLRIVQANYTQQWCTWAFPNGTYNSIPAEPNPKYYQSYGNFNLSAPRLALIDGSADVWNDLCYHSTLPQAPAARYGANQYFIAGGGHHWDSYGILNVSAEPDYIREAHEWEIRRVHSWLEEWNSTHSSNRKRDEL